MRNALLAIALLATTATLVDAKPRKHAAARKDSQWMRNCIHERTGPDGGVSKSEARQICKAEQPDDELEAAKSALALAKANAKVLKAKERARKAIEACEQAITDACIEAALPDGSSDCNTDEGLHAEFTLVCLGQAAK